MEGERGVADERRGGLGWVQERLGASSLQAEVGEEDGVVGEGDDGDVEAIGGFASVDEGEGENGEADHGGDASVDDDRFVRVALAGALGLVDHGTMVPGSEHTSLGVVYESRDGAVRVQIVVRSSEEWIGIRKSVVLLVEAEGLKRDLGV